jgi:5-oxoprolinase (ATP-hydrolysing)
VDGVDYDAPVLLREALRPGGTIAGPALVLEETGTVVVEPGFELHVEDDGRMILEDRAGVTRERATAEVDPVLLEIFNNLFMAIAEQMGTVLRRTALSTNIRERLDFSCAVFDREGSLVANAPHIPVHLGAMGESVRSVLAAHPSPRPGDVYVTNDPAGGGSHLPDITVVTPVHDPGGGVAFFVASRGHHADVGGITPGSMPAFSTSLAEEGVVFRAIRVVRDGRFDRDGVRALLCAGPYPARRPDENIADLEAQIAANRRGERLLGELSARYGREVVDAYMRHVQDNAALRVADALAAIPDGSHAFADAMDDGTEIRVCLRVAGSTVAVDFTGTGAQVAGNLNAPRAVTVAAVLYVVRCLVGEPIPLNSGCLRHVTIHVPPGSILAPDADCAVAGGNVETSQRVVDVLLGALGRAAASQGTMNNLTFGDEGFGYYETIAGGAGASDGCPGASGVHTHMTNSRITDPEVLEARFPVRLIQFSFRRGSGGAGRYRGGAGLVRELEALRPLRFSILAERRTRAPFGLRGGSAGAPGRSFHGETELAGKAEVAVAAGERIRIETPGGGGFGAPA